MILAYCLCMEKSLQNENLRDENLRVPSEFIERRIYLIRGKKVMLDQDLAELYQVETRVLNQAVSRNKIRFPDDFVLILSEIEAKSLRSQSVISKKGKGGRRYLPLAFTEQGVAMLSSVLRSERAVLVNIAIMRAFVRLRELLSSNQELSDKLDSLEKKYDSHFKIVFTAIRKLMEKPASSTKRIGFE